MTILLVLIPLGVMLLAVAIGAFVWAVRNDQFEDLESEGSRILFDEVEPSGVRAAGEAVSTGSDASSAEAGVGHASSGRDGEGRA